MYLFFFFFLPQQNQLSRQRRKRGSLGGSSLGQDLRDPGLLERTRRERGLDNTRGEEQRGGKREEKKEEGYQKRREKRWDIQCIRINRSWTGRQPREWAAAADKAIPACQNPAARSAIYEDPSQDLTPNLHPAAFCSPSDMCAHTSVWPLSHARALQTQGGYVRFETDLNVFNKWSWSCQHSWQHSCMQFPLHIFSISVMHCHLTNQAGAFTPVMS